MLVDALIAWMQHRGIAAVWAQPLGALLGLVALVAAAWLASVIAKRVILELVQRVIKRTLVRWDDIFLTSGVFSRLSYLAPAVVAAWLGEGVLLRAGVATARLRVALDIYVVVIALLVIDALLDTVVELYNQGSTTRRVPLKGFTQGTKLVAFLLGAVLITSLLLGQSPIYLLSGLGALTAVLLLVFKDALLGLVAGVQISVNRMVQIGDWIEMSKYGADGDVIDVGLTTVKVQNWDKTITTVPTYALISDPVKNWRGMQESGGRRIKRAALSDTMGSWNSNHRASADDSRASREKTAPSGGGKTECNNDEDSRCYEFVGIVRRSDEFVVGSFRETRSHEPRGNVNVQPTAVTCHVR
jgi:miniconductance mechanosensitive channel